MSKHGWIGVDLDGTLAHYEGWGDGSIGEPVPLMLARVRAWVAEGRQVRILTARWHNGAEAIKDIEDWTERHVGVRLPVTATKDFEMVELWDDRAVTVEANTGRCMAHGHPEGPA